MTDPTGLPASVTKDQLAHLLNVSISTVDRLRKVGMPVVSRGRGAGYPLRECVTWYADYCASEAVRTGGTTMSEDEAKVRKTLAEAQLKELELAEAQGLVVAIDDSEKEVNALLEKLRQRLLAIPAVWGPQILGFKTAEEAVAQLATLIDRVMTELAQDDFDDEEEEDGIDPTSPEEPEATTE